MSYCLKMICQTRITKRPYQRFRSQAAYNYLLSLATYGIFNELGSIVGRGKQHAEVQGRSHIW